MFFYGDSVHTGQISASMLARFDATKKYLEHYSNSLILSLYLKDGTRIEKQQASTELAICERKMKYWERHENFDKFRMIKGCDDLKKQWGNRLA